MAARGKPFQAFSSPVRVADDLRRTIGEVTRRSELRCMPPLIAAADLPAPMRSAVRDTATALVRALRDDPGRSGVQDLVQEYALSSQEGVALMCLAEAMLRIPDEATRDALIRDKIAGADWAAHIGDGRSLFVNAATWGLVVTGRLTAGADDGGLSAALTRLVARLGEPVIRRGVDIAMRLMGEQFVAGETIDAALRRAGVMEARGFTYSFDMLGEAATTSRDAARYYASYEQAIDAIGRRSRGRGPYVAPGISIKLSALHPRYGRQQAERVMAEMLPRVRALALLARSYDIGFNIDAEEADRVDLSLDILQSLAEDPELAGWDGLGFVVQAYGKRCPFVIDWIVALARGNRRRIMVRLVKGAYWDTEIKRAQVDGLADFPVYTRKVHTDVAYIACARKLLGARDAVFPQFATHNAQTVATILHLAGPDFTPGDWEFQCLHGMGEPLYEHVVGPRKLNRPCRIYAPVGTHDTLLAYLVRRLLENGANSSFVHRIGDPDVPIEALVVDPVEEARALPETGSPHPAIALPADILGPRRNSAGLDLADEATLAMLGNACAETVQERWTAAPDQGGRLPHELRSPADSRDLVGIVIEADEAEAALAVARAAGVAEPWAAVPVAERAAMLERAADALQAQMPELIGLMIREAGKSAANAVAEVREAIDFLRYYAAEGRRGLEDTRPLGPIVCISPWNFPLAIFTGQVAAALVAGNPVLAKPAEQTPLIAAQAIALLHAAGVPKDALQLLPGAGDVGAALVAARETAGVLFTGSTEVARAIQRQLAARTAADGHPIPLVAETGGINAMIVDSSALAEQVVADVIASAFDSAGQRCSALRLLCLQEEIADPFLVVLKGAMRELSVGPTDRLSVDVGPVISHEAAADILRHVADMRTAGHKVLDWDLGEACAHGSFVAPALIEIDEVSDLRREVFGPVLHVLRYRAADMDRLVDAINAQGYGLTFGLQTRLNGTADRITGAIAAGNVYVNRNMIGAVVGVQPFGGRGLSGTGPKAGGPLYLTRLVADPLVPQFDRPAVPALAALIGWFEDRGEQTAANRARAALRSSRLGLELELPGPVGESNLYICEAKGTVALCARSERGLRDQLAAALATGNNAIVSEEHARHQWLSELPDVAARAIVWSDAALAEPDIAAVLVERTEDVLSVAAALADREGPIVPLQLARPEGYVLDWLIDERSISINTAAAGGNASLMAIA